MASPTSSSCEADNQAESNIGQELPAPATQVCNANISSPENANSDNQLAPQSQECQVPVSSDTSSTQKPIGNSGTEKSELIFNHASYWMQCGTLTEKDFLGNQTKPGKWVICIHDRPDVGAGIAPKESSKSIKERLEDVWGKVQVKVDQGEICYAKRTTTDVAPHLPSYASGPQLVFVYTENCQDVKSVKKVADLIKRDIYQDFHVICYFQESQFDWGRNYHCQNLMYKYNVEGQMYKLNNASEHLAQRLDELKESRRHTLNENYTEQNKTAENLEKSLDNAMQLADQKLDQNQEKFTAMTKCLDSVAKCPSNEKGDRKEERSSEAPKDCDVSLSQLCLASQPQGPMDEVPDSVETDEMTVSANDPVKPDSQSEALEKIKQDVRDLWKSTTEGLDTTTPNDKAHEPVSDDSEKTADQEKVYDEDQENSIRNEQDSEEVKEAREKFSDRSKFVSDKLTDFADKLQSLKSKVGEHESSVSENIASTRKELQSRLNEHQQETERKLREMKERIAKMRENVRTITAGKNGLETPSVRLGSQDLSQSFDSSNQVDEQGDAKSRALISSGVGAGYDFTRKRSEHKQKIAEMKQRLDEAMERIKCLSDSAKSITPEKGLLAGGQNWELVNIED